MSLLVIPPAGTPDGFNDGIPEPENGTAIDGNNPKPVDARILNLYFREVQRVLGGVVKCNASGIPYQNEDDYETLDGDLDNDNIRSIGERKVKFYELDPPNSGHDHDGVESTKVSDTPESGITFDKDDGHHHDGVDTPLLALATGGKQGSVILRSGTTGVGGYFAIDLKALDFTQIPYCIRVWVGTNNYGIGELKIPAPEGGYWVDRGYHWRINTDDDEILLKIYSRFVGGSNFTWYAIGI